MAQGDNTNQEMEMDGRIGRHAAPAVETPTDLPPAAEASVAENQRAAEASTTSNPHATESPVASTPPRPRDFLKTEKRIRRRVHIAGTFVLIVLVSVIIAGAQVGIISGANLLNSASGQTSALTTHGFLELTVAADGWDAEGSTPAIARLRPADSEEYLLCRAVPADARDTVELDEGVYYLSWITPVDADGTLYIPPEGEEPVEIRAGHTTSRTAVFRRVPVNESTFGDYAATVEIVGDAIAHGDETMSGEAGDALMHKLQVNANEAPNFFIYIPEEEY